MMRLNVQLVNQHSGPLARIVSEIPDEQISAAALAFLLTREHWEFRDGDSILIRIEDTSAPAEGR